MSRRWQQVRHQLRRNRPAQFSLFVLFIFVVAALCAGLSPYDPDRMALGARTLPPDAAHWFGTDEYGRDYFTRALYGGQISLMVGFLAMLFSTLIGTVVGTVSGYFGGWLDNLMMRAVDILMAIPSFFLLLVVNAYLKPGVDNIILIISLLTWMNMSRLVRAETLSVKEREYVLYARASGEHPLRIIVRHIIPGVLPTIIVAATLNIASAILMESTLSFLGLGVQARPAHVFAAVGAFAVAAFVQACQGGAHSYQLIVVARGFGVAHAVEKHAFGVLFAVVWVACIALVGNLGQGGTLDFVQLLQQLLLALQQLGAQLLGLFGGQGGGGRGHGNRNQQKMGGSGRVRLPPPGGGRRRSGHGVGRQALQHGQAAGDGAGQFAAIHNHVHRTLFLQKFRTLKAFGQLHAHGGFNHPGASKTNQRFGLSNHDVTHKGKTG